jgi:hypothetical protein
VRLAGCAREADHPREGLLKGVSRMDREREMAMMTGPNQWPLWPILPLKNRGPEWPELGFLREESFDTPIRPVVFIGSIFEPDKAVPKEYLDFDGILDDGWIVD